MTESDDRSGENSVGAAPSLAPTASSAWETFEAMCANVLGAPETPDPDGRPVLYRFLGELLDPREHAGTGNFVTIGGVSMDVDDLIDAIHGRDFIPLLNPAEILATAPHGGYHADYHEGAYDVYYRRPGQNRDRVAGRLRRAREIKMAEIKDLVRVSTRNVSVELPRREVILAALATSRFPFFNDLTTFIAQTAQLDSASADGAIEAARQTADLTGETEPSSRAIRPSVFERISATPHVEAIARLLGVSSEEIADVPVIILERAALGHPFEEDDAHQFAVADHPPRIEAPSSVRDIQSLFGIYIAAIVGVGGAIISDGMDAKYYFITGATGIASLLMGNFLFSSITGKSIRNVIREFRFKRLISGLQDKWLETYRSLGERIEALERTGNGRLRTVTLREVLLQHNGATPPDEGTLTALENFIGELEGNTDLLTAFEAFPAFHPQVHHLVRG